MAQRMQNALQSANQNNRALTFIVVVPTVTNNAVATSSSSTALQIEFAASSFRLLRKMATSSLSSSKKEGKHHQNHLVLNAREHGYVEGAQHMRPTRFKESSYDTSVMILQSTRAQKEYPVGEEWERRIREAFTSQHDSEIRERRGKQDANLEGKKEQLGNKAD
eukprot:CAMPEP_0202460104 /NCGR_PEP_ID=MMETSP1360-20130828/41593_1 /ASSEMBLY_ACC=CAM_ASM_000848 /TAXON_ID=515479 /ORGANISM="Licmophora paradoxa, Strain CCMP2313" /LENGTH=163 /DNA_ID=CAMNT_0049081607 /DNA_START=106 /DNA_END=597 /DNA_ORIENTATION=-